MINDRVFFISWYESGPGQVQTVQFVYNPAFDGEPDELLTQEECDIYRRVCHEVNAPEDWTNEEDVVRYRQEVRKRFKEQKMEERPIKRAVPPLYKMDNVPESHKKLYNRETFTLQSLMRSIYKDWKNKIGWYEQVERVYKQDGKHPDWFQKLIDEDAQKNSNEKKAGEPEVESTEEGIKD